MVDSNLAPEFVECHLLWGVLTDPAVPRCAITGTLRSRACLDGVVLIHLAFLPAIGSLEQLAPRRESLLIRWQLYVFLIENLVATDGPT